MRFNPTRRGGERFAKSGNAFRRRRGNSLSPFVRYRRWEGWKGSLLMPFAGR